MNICMIVMTALSNNNKLSPPACDSSSSQLMERVHGQVFSFTLVWQCGIFLQSLRRLKALHRLKFDKSTR